MKDVHAFSVALAIEVGLVRAIILSHFKFLAQEIAANSKGNWRTQPVKRSVAALRHTYPYLTQGEIRGALNYLEEQGYLLSLVVNDDPFDRSKSYSLGAKSIEHFSEKTTPVKSEHPFVNCANGVAESENVHLLNLQMLNSINSNTSNNSHTNAQARENFENESLKSEVGTESSSEPQAFSGGAAGPGPDGYTLPECVDIAEQWCKRNPEQLKFYMETARVHPSQMTPQILKQEILNFFSYYRSKSGKLHECYREPERFFCEGFAKWLINYKHGGNQRPQASRPQGGRRKDVRDYDYSQNTGFDGKPLQL